MLEKKKNTEKIIQTIKKNTEKNFIKIKKLMKTKKKKKKSVRKEDKNFNKLTINSEEQITYQLEKNSINLLKKIKKN